MLERLEPGISDYYHHMLSVCCCFFLFNMCLGVSLLNPLFLVVQCQTESNNVQHVYIYIYLFRQFKSPQPTHPQRPPVPCQRQVLQPKLRLAAALVVRPRGGRLRLLRAGDLVLWKDAGGAWPGLAKPKIWRCLLNLFLPSGKLT